MGNLPVVARINSLLAEKDIKKTDFYRACNITSATFSLWKTGKTAPRRKNLETIAQYLNTTPEYLLTGLGDKEKAPVQKDERDSEALLKAAFFEGADPSLTQEEIDDLWEDAKEYMHFKIKQREMRRNNEH